MYHPGAKGIIIRGPESGSAVIETTGSSDVVVIGATDVTLSGVSLRGRGGVYAAKNTTIAITAVKIDGASIGIHIDENSSAALDGLTILGASDVGLLVRNGSSIDATNLQIIDSNVAVAAVAHSKRLVLRNSEIHRAKGPGIFAGMTGCGDLGAATLDLPSCFYSNPSAYITQTTVSLDNVVVRDGPGTGIVFFPGVSADVHRLDVGAWGLTGLFAWGARVNIANSTFDDNVEHAIEFRAFPDPRGSILKAATGTIEDTVIRSSRPLPNGWLGGGFIAQAAQVNLRRSVIEANAGIGVLFENGSSGELVGSRVIGNGQTGVCINRGNAVRVLETVISGNAGNNPHGCGG